ncbi:MAG: type II toxin-antitoxin system RelE/ParE family toxin [Verrucomicrobiae bacterium]|nr:type II toxin-antitoxin system RelE/ParE family toxin [Verrucomicrobiae bacterium]
MTVFWFEEAQFDLSEQALYYELKQEGLGDRFIDQMEETLARIVQDPIRRRLFDGSHRKENFRNFPYALLYRIREDEIQIVAIMALERAPGYWKDRVRD